MKHETMQFNTKQYTTRCNIRDVEASTGRMVSVRFVFRAKNVDTGVAASTKKYKVPIVKSFTNPCQAIPRRGQHGIVSRTD